MQGGPRDIIIDVRRGKHSGWQCNWGSKQASDSAISVSNIVLTWREGLVLVLVIKSISLNEVSFLFGVFPVSGILVE